MKIIITAAGFGTRFKKIGIDTPKYKIEVKGKSLYEWSMNSLKDFFDEEFILIFRNETFDKDYIDKINSKIGIKRYKYLIINEPTDGQATTAFKANNMIENNESIIIYNIDTSIDEYEIKKTDIKPDMDGFIPVFKSQGDNWSFVRINNENKVIQIEEKNPISNLASIGFYYFNKWSIFKEIYLKYNEEIKKSNKEVYIAPMYKYLINMDKFIGIKVLDNKVVNILGTPEEVKSFKDK